jgi:hypothetical protein
MDRAAALSALDSGDPVAVSQALVAIALHDPDREWVEGECLRLASNNDPGVRGTAGLCLGHLARRFGAVLDESWETARRLCDDPAVDNRPCDAVEDMRMFANRQ